MIHTRAKALGLVLAVTVCGRAHADDDAKKTAAEALFQQGRAALQSGKIEEACEKLDASQKLDPAVGSLLHLADCYERLGRTASAWMRFKEAASLAKATGHAQRAKIAQVRAIALEPKLVKLTVTAASRPLPMGFELLLNGVRIPEASWGVALPVDPGEQRIAARAPGYRGHEATARVDAQERNVRIEVPALTKTPKAVAEPAAAAIAAPPPAVSGESSPRASGNTQRTLGYTALGLGVVGLAAGAAFGVAARNKDDDSRGFCRDDDPSLCSRQGVELREDAQRFAGYGTVTFAAGSVFAVTSVVLLLTAPKRREAPVSAGFDRRGASVQVGGTF